MRDWYIRNQDAISWFLIGWLAMSAFYAFDRGDYGWAAFDVFLAYVNYKLVSVRL